MHCFNSKFSLDGTNNIESAKKHYILTTESLFLVCSENNGGLFAYFVSSTCAEGHYG